MSDADIKNLLLLLEGARELVKGCASESMYDFIYNNFVGEIELMQKFVHDDYGVAIPCRAEARELIKSMEVDE